MSRSISNALRLVAGASLFLVAGCSSGIQMNEQVEGTVKLDGAPLANVVVEFVPNLKSTTQAPVSSATTDASGHFKLICANQKPGAVVGKHNVLIRVGRGGGNGGAEEMDAPAAAPQSNAKRPTIPADYTSAQKTPIKIEVTADKHSYDVNISSTSSTGYKNPDKDKE